MAKNKMAVNGFSASTVGDSLLVSSVIGLNQGVTGLPLKGWPLTGIEQLRPSLGVQVQKPNIPTQNQFILASQQQQVLAHAQAQSNLGNSPNYGDMDPRRLCGIPRGSLNTKDGQSARNDGSICSPVQSSSPKFMPRALKALRARTKVAVRYGITVISWNMALHNEGGPDATLFLSTAGPVAAAANAAVTGVVGKCHNFLKFFLLFENILIDCLVAVIMPQNNRKRKQHSSSGPANSTGTGNTVGPSPNSPPSTHTPGDGMTMASSLQHVNSVPKSLMMYGPDGTGGLASSSNLLDDMEHFGDIGSLDDNVESFLSHDGGDGRDLYGTTELKKESSKGFTFAEVGCLRASNGKVTCCHFSSDGKFLASAGHDKKAVLWNMDTLQRESTPEEHQFVITDIRFRPNSTQLATASYDKSVRLWDAAKPTYCVNAYTGHGSHVMSLDFHPKKTDLFCFSDSNNEIRYWNISPFSCTRVFKGGNVQVRFQPRIGHLLAAAMDKVVSIFDVETDRQIHSLQGHSEMVNYLSWDANGEFMASVSPDLVKVWSIASGECIHELSSNGSQFHSCVFHPSYPTLLVIGGIRSLELWNMAENKCMTVPAHESIVAALAQSPVNGMVASASHDSSVKIWK
ncbi:Transcriptional corepressor LEUNIG-like [Vitis vinifera]|uniref:Transcriptional corepressor LEUNIG-like n=1 Tax=Vitis vinifera TaxID=29760 RepID=A0A438FI05_VITVI|nr:Transcriptional corepressor LEUNIG-like [Vitis vinifera]